MKETNPINLDIDGHEIRTLGLKLKEGKFSPNGVCDVVYFLEFQNIPEKVVCYNTVEVKIVPDGASIAFSIDKLEAKTASEALDKLAIWLQACAATIKGRRPPEISIPVFNG